MRIIHVISIILLYLWQNQVLAEKLVVIAVLNLNLNLERREKLCALKPSELARKR